MLVKFSRQLIESIDDGNLKRFSIDTDHVTRYGYSSIAITIDDLGETKVKELKAMVEKSTVFGAKACRKDLEHWLEAQKVIKKKGGQDSYADMRARRVEHFADYLRRYFAGRKNHRVYIRDQSRGVTFCSYIFDIDYHPKSTGYHGDPIPEHITFDLGWIEFGQPHSETIYLRREDCRRKTARDTLRKRDIYFPDPLLDEEYEESVKKFNSIVDNVGEQYLASGIGTDDVDSASNSNSRRWWSRYYSNDIQLDKDGDPSNCVIDVFKESDEEDSHKDRDNIDYTWWHGVRFGIKNIVGEEDDEDDDKDEDIEDEEIEEEEIPIRPNLVIFALRKQKRMRVHVDQLVKYKYDKRMGEKLILPEESNSLVKTLVSWKGGFQDIVKNKGGGAVILCAGIPGTGKTLTAEVYAEVMEKPLYTVQCSQLGTDPDALEESLLIIFARSERWKAILLLDEADVYIHERGDDLNQNAIVGVFLRVMEYYRGVMFMTTNRAELVDDAVASRCIARVEYTAPNKADAKSIWKIQADVQGVPVSDSVINETVKKYPELTGRDIKNIMKLAKLVHTGKSSISIGTIDFCKKFKPTR